MTMLRDEDALLKRVETVFSTQDGGAVRLGIGDDAALMVETSPQLTSCCAR